MLLAVDIGNSHTVLGIFKGERLVHDWRIKTDRKCTADEISSKLHVLFSIKEISFDMLNGFIMASVVPTVQACWMKFAKSLVESPLKVDNTTNSGITIAIDNPAEVGADRIVNAAAAFHTYNCPLVIIDFGTAITWDCVSGKGAYMGGAIAPGLGISMEALGQRTAKLPTVDISTPPKNPVGTSTVEAIKSGILYGYGGMVDGLVARITEQMRPEIPKVIATGGMAPLIAPYSLSIEKVEPFLTLEGLRLIHERAQ